MIQSFGVGRKHRVDILAPSFHNKSTITKMGLTQRLQYTGDQAPFKENQ